MQCEIISEKVNAFVLFPAYNCKEYYYVAGNIFINYTLIILLVVLISIHLISIRDRKEEEKSSQAVPQAFLSSTNLLSVSQSKVNVTYKHKAQANWFTGLHFIKSPFITGVKLPFRRTTKHC